MLSLTALFATVVTFGQLIDGLSAHRDSFDFDVTAQVALCRSNETLTVSVIGEWQPDVWRSVFFPVSAQEAAVLQPGDRVRVRGRFDASKQGMLDRTPLLAFAGTSVTRIGPAPFPPAKAVEGGEINCGLRLRSIVSVRGVLASVARDETNPHLVWLIVRTTTGKFRALADVSDYPFEGLVALKDAEIELTGLCDVTWDWRRFLGHHLMVFGRDGIACTRPAPGSAFDGDRLGIGTQALHREHASGTVIAIGERDVFIRQDGGMFLPVTLEADACPPAVGTHVDVAGFVEPDQNNMRLVEGVIRPTGKPGAGPEPARDFDIGLLTGRMESAPRMIADIYGQVIRFRGTLNEPGVPTDQVRTLSVQCGSQTVPLDVAALRGRLDGRLCGGCEVEVCGICSVVFEKDPTGAAFPKFKGLIVIPRTAGDIRILRLPPWWTPARFVWTVGLLLALLLGILAWNAVLRRTVIRKSTALLKEQVARLEETLKIDERTRLAAELHDYLAQNLTVVSYRLSAALSAFRMKRADTVDYLESADRMLRSCRVDLRRCLWDLRNDSLDEPDFGRAVAKSVTPVSGKAALHVRFSVRRSKLSDTTAHAILSICRELVANAVLHGKATTVRIAGEAKDGAINFSVRDDGCGFDPATRPGQAEGHFGLDGLMERIKRLDGTFTIDSAPGRGTRVAVSVKNGGTK